MVYGLLSLVVPITTNYKPQTTNYKLLKYEIATIIILRKQKTINKRR